jgi:arsenical-resistance protein 2
MAEPQVLTLEGGIKGWVAGGAPYRALVDGYVESYWMQFDEVKTAGKRTVDTSMGGDAMEEDEQDSPTKRRILGVKWPGGSAV